MKDTRQDISLKIFGPITNPARLILRFGNEWANFPSVANSKRFTSKTGKLIWNTELRKKLETFHDLVKNCCLMHLKAVPQFKEKLVAFIALSEVNKRKDIDNCFKGIIDWAIQRTGIVENDNLILVLPIPFWWSPEFHDEGYSYIDLQKWSSVEGDYRRLLRRDEAPLTYLWGSGPNNGND